MFRVFEYAFDNNGSEVINAQWVTLDHKTVLERCDELSCSDCVRDSRNLGVMFMWIRRSDCGNWIKLRFDKGTIEVLRISDFGINCTKDTPESQPLEELIKDKR